MKIFLHCSKRVIPGLYVNRNHLVRTICLTLYKLAFFVVKYVGLPHCIVEGSPKDLAFLQFLNFCCGLVPYLCSPSFSLAVIFFSLLHVYFCLRSCNDSLLMQSINELEKLWCKVRFDTCSQSEILMERKRTDPKMAKSRSPVVSSAPLLGIDLSLHFHCVDQDCTCVFPIDLDGNCPQSGQCTGLWKCRDEWVVLPAGERMMHSHFMFLIDWKEQRAAGAVLILDI